MNTNHFRVAQNNHSSCITTHFLFLAHQFVFYLLPLASFTQNFCSQRTNHLDLETTEALIDAIREFKGGVLMVSHDQHLLTSVCKTLLVVENNQVKNLQGGRSNKDAFEAYKKAVVSGKR